MKEANSIHVQTKVGSEMDDTFQEFGGSPNYVWNIVLVDQAAQSLWTGNSPNDKFDSQFNATIAALGGIAPKDELEGMMAAQLLAAHNAAMECHRRAVLRRNTQRRHRAADDRRSHAPRLRHQ